MQKASKKSHTGHAEKTVFGAVGPFKNKKTRHQNIRKQDWGIKHALADKLL